MASGRCVKHTRGQELRCKWHQIALNMLNSIKRKNVETSITLFTSKPARSKSTVRTSASACIEAIMCLQ
jgi:hypothetical protein